jgi:hypothetical protein
MFDNNPTTYLCIIKRKHQPYWQIGGQNGGVKALISAPFNLK